LRTPQPHATVRRRSRVPTPAAHDRHAEVHRFGDLLKAWRTARRYSLAACWAAIGGVLLAAWLISRPELEFDARNAYLIGAFCSLSLVWHLGFLRILARSWSPSDPGPATGLAAR